MWLKVCAGRFAGIAVLRMARWRPRSYPRRLRVGDDPVAAILLGAVERLIRALEQRLGGVSAVRGRRADRDRHVERTLLGLHREGLIADLLAQALGDLQRAVRVDARECHDELLAAEATRQVDAAQARGDPGRDLAQHL